MFQQQTKGRHNRERRFETKKPEYRPKIDLMKKRGNYYSLLFISLLALVVFLYRKNDRGTVKQEQQKEERQPDRTKKTTDPAGDPGGRKEGFNRGGKLIYTKHALCRMDCRKIDESEVKEILEKGNINYSKSDPASRPDPKYALEGTTRDNQRVRIVFASSESRVVVITVIDLDTEWSCDCK